MDEARRLERLKVREINHAKEVFAYELTVKIVHGEEKRRTGKTGGTRPFSGGAEGGRHLKPRLKADFAEGMIYFLSLQLSASSHAQADALYSRAA